MLVLKTGENNSVMEKCNNITENLTLRHTYKYLMGKKHIYTHTCSWSWNISQKLRNKIQSVGDVSLQAHCTEKSCITEGDMIESCSYIT